MSNVVKNHILFPTVLNQFEYIADKKLIDAIKNQDLETKHNPFLSQSSVNNTLHKEKKFEGITNKILETTKEVCNFYGYVHYESIEITNFWINFSKKNCSHTPHTHSNNVFSGVWFPFENTSNTPIIFQDPRPAASVLQPQFNVNNYNCSLMSFQPNKNLGYIFPSWLMHYVPPTTKNRISLSWNILIRGKYGEPNHLQNAYI